jgi:hypothetical protein
MYKHTNIKILTYKSTCNRQFKILINRNKVKRNLTKKKWEKFLNEENETSNRQLGNLINKNKVRKSLTNQIKWNKWTNKENETNKKTKKKITLSKIKWENC